MDDESWKEAPIMTAQLQTQDILGRGLSLRYPFVLLHRVQRHLLFRNPVNLEQLITSSNYPITDSSAHNAQSSVLWEGNVEVGHWIGLFQLTQIKWNRQHSKSGVLFDNFINKFKRELVLKIYKSVHNLWLIGEWNPQLCKLAGARLIFKSSL